MKLNYLLTFLLLSVFITGCNSKTYHKNTRISVAEGARNQDDIVRILGTIPEVSKLPEYQALKKNTGDHFQKAVLQAQEKPPGVNLGAVGNFFGSLAPVVGGIIGGPGGSAIGEAIGNTAKAFVQDPVKGGGTAAGTLFLLYKMWARRKEEEEKRKSAEADAENEKREKRKYKNAGYVAARETNPEKAVEIMNNAKKLII